MTMDSLQKLREIGVNKINQDTKLSISVIENILEKRFDKIQRIWVVGFLAILEREYGVDLSEWLQEYDAYRAQNVPDTIDTYKIKELELDMRQHDISHKRFLLFKQILFILLGLCAVVVFFFIKIFSFSDTGRADYNIVEKPLEQSSESKQQDIYTQLNLPQIQEENKNIETGKFTKDNETQVQAGEVLITPKGELWFQVLNIATKAKRNRTIKGPYLLKLPAQKSIIIFAHKGFELKYKGKTQKFDGQGPIRFIIENNSLKYIRYADYLRILGIQDVQPEVQPNDEMQEKSEAQETKTIEMTETKIAPQDAPSNADISAISARLESKTQDVGESVQEKPKQIDVQENDVEEN